MPSIQLPVSIQVSVNGIPVQITVDLTIDYVEVQGSAKYPYQVVLVNGVPVSCSCPDFSYRGSQKNLCKHMIGVFMETPADISPDQN